MAFVSNSNKNNKFFNIRKRVYDVMNIFIALGMVLKNKTTFSINQKQTLPGFLGSQKPKNEGGFLTQKQDKFLTKIEALVK